MNDPRGLVMPDGTADSDSLDRGAAAGAEIDSVRVLLCNVYEPMGSLLVGCGAAAFADCKDSMLVDFRSGDEAMGAKLAGWNDSVLVDFRREYEPTASVVDFRSAAPNDSMLVDFRSPYECTAACVSSDVKPATMLGIPLTISKPATREN